MAPKYKLTYFSFKGLGEPIRYLLSYGGVEFEDLRIDFNEWTPSLKKTFPFGKLPVLEIDGRVVTQCKSICRYLAKETGLSGKDNWENLQIDVMTDTFDDLRLAVVGYCFDPNEKSKAAKKDPVLNETLPFYLNKLDTIVSENNGYLALKRLTWVDMYFVGVIEHLSFLLQQDLFEPYANLDALKETVHAIPNIKKYIAKRPADVPLNLN